MAPFEALYGRKYKSLCDGTMLVREDFWDYKLLPRQRRKSRSSADILRRLRTDKRIGWTWTGNPWSLQWEIMYS